MLQLLIKNRINKVLLLDLFKNIDLLLQLDILVVDSTHDRAERTGSKRESEGATYAETYAEHSFKGGMRGDVSKSNSCDGCDGKVKCSHIFCQIIRILETFIDKPVVFTVFKINYQYEKTSR